MLLMLDGGIIGGPVWKLGKTWLYLPCKQAVEVEELFNAGSLELKILEQDPGQASAIKMCFAAYTKGSGFAGYYPGSS